jgi:hypothetical protein
MIATDKQNPVEKLNKVLRADPKKTGALAVLFLCVGVMIVRTMMPDGGSTGAKAAATVNGKSGRGGSGPGGTSGDSAGGSNSGWRSGAPGNPPLSVGAAMLRWADAPVSPLSRNLFSVRIDYFPVDGSRTLQSTTADEGFWAKLEKSLALQADQRDKRENLIANFKAQAAKLRLESTMMGPQPKAMVNGELVGEGSVVASFRVLKIEARRMIVEREGIRLEINMK